MGLLDFTKITADIPESKHVIPSDSRVPIFEMPDSDLSFVRQMAAYINRPYLEKKYGPGSTRLFHGTEMHVFNDNVTHLEEIMDAGSMVLETAMSSLEKYDTVWDSWQCNRPMREILSMVQHCAVGERNYITDVATSAVKSVSGYSAFTETEPVDQQPETILKMSSIICGMIYAGMDIFENSLDISRGPEEYMCPVPEFYQIISVLRLADVSMDEESLIASGSKLVSPEDMWILLARQAIQLMPSGVKIAKAIETTTFPVPEIQNRNFKPVTGEFLRDNTFRATYAKLLLSLRNDFISLRDAIRSFHNRCVTQFRDLEGDDSGFLADYRGVSVYWTFIAIMTRNIKMSGIVLHNMIVDNLLIVAASVFSVIREMFPVDLRNTDEGTTFYRHLAHNFKTAVSAINRSSEVQAPDHEDN